MEIIAGVYELRERDLSDPRWSPVNVFQSETGNAAAVWAATPVSPPLDKAWIITGVHGQLTPGGGDSAVSFRARVAPVGGTAILSEPFVWRAPIGIGANTSWLQSQQTNFVLIGGVHQLNSVFGFVAGNVANTGIWGLVGFEVPRGNVTLR